MLKAYRATLYFHRYTRSYANAAWQTTVGLELHAQLATPTKLFSPARQRFGGPTNEDLEPFDLALPGSLPSLNPHAALLAARAAIALDCNVNPRSTFDRKHYIYPDQPAGYQITQHHKPLAQTGFIILTSRDEASLNQPIQVPILQIQLEQDTAKTLYFAQHDPSDPAGAEILVDANRSGTALIEIVTGPALPSGRAAAACLRKIQAILRSIGASEASMEAGGLRCDVNVSVRRQDQRQPAQRVEIKNLASARTVMDAVDAEAKRQVEALTRGEPIAAETRGYDVAAGTTFKMRSKETATDYRYMPEPDLPPVLIDAAFLEQCRTHLAALPDAVLDRLTGSGFGLQLKDARVLEADRLLLQCYEDVLRRSREKLEQKADGKALDKLPRTVAAWLVHDMLGRQNALREASLDPAVDIPLPSTKQLTDLVVAVVGGVMTRQSGQRILGFLLECNDTVAVADLIQQHGLALATGADASAASAALARQALEEVMQQNPAQTEKLHAGDVKIGNWFLGQILRRVKGKCTVKDIEALIAIERSRN